MALGKKKIRQEELFVATVELRKGPGHPFCAKLNEVFAEAGFDPFAETLCAPYYREGGRPGIPPGVYFPMVFVGYLEGIDSQRGIGPGGRPHCGGVRWPVRQHRPCTRR